MPPKALAQGRDLDEERGRAERDLELSLYLQEQINYFKSKGDVDRLLAAQACQCSPSASHGASPLKFFPSLFISPQCIWPQANDYLAPILNIVHEPVPLLMRFFDSNQRGRSRKLPESGSGNTGDRLTRSKAKAQLKRMAGVEALFTPSGTVGQ